MTVPKTPRQAVVIVHGMGEQRPLEALNRFIDAAIPGCGPATADTGQIAYYSRPDQVADSYESRRYLAPATDRYAQTEFFEYHWAHLMQGNMLSDMWATLRRMLLQWPWRVPTGLRVVWAIFWVLIIAVVWFILRADIEFGVKQLITALVGGGVAGTVLTWILTKLVPGKISSTFVDVVRYLDTSPRSYGVRKAIRGGMVKMLKDLHKTGRYQRIVVVAHSLGAYVAYDGITYLWTELNQRHLAAANGAMNPGAISKLEAEAKKLRDEEQSDPEGPSDPTSFQAAQRALWKEMRKQGNPWLITDFVTAGTPMYMADLLMTHNKKDLDAKKRLRQIAACPPLPDLPVPGAQEGEFRYSYDYRGGPVLYHAAPFAVVRWTNMWFPAHGNFFGDWFGGPLQRLFGRGIKDIRLTGNGWKPFLPAFAHTLYFQFPDDETEESVTAQLHAAMDLDSASWLTDLLGIQSAPVDGDS